RSGDLRMSKRAELRRLGKKAYYTLRDDGLGFFARKTLTFGKHHIKRLSHSAVAMLSPSRPPPKLFRDVLFIDGCTLPHPSRYRVIHQVEQLKMAGLSATGVFYEQLTLEHVKYHHALVFFRCPHTDMVAQAIALAKRLNKAVLFDIDDLVI